MVHGEKGNDIEWRLEGLKRKSLLESFGEFAHDFRMHDLWREFAAAEIGGGKFKDQYFLRESKECNGKVNLTGFPMMKVVKLVDVAEDVALDVRGLKQLKSLEVVVEGSEDFVLEINGLGTLEILTYLRCEGVASSACITELGWLTKLEVVELVFFEGDKLPDMSKLTNLRILNMEYSRFLQRIELRNLPNLALLNIWECVSLKSVDISGCRSMIEVEGFNTVCGTLEELNVSSCPLLSSVSGLAHLSKLRKLRKLDITGCSSIMNMDDLEDFVALEELRARQCDCLSRLSKCRLPKLRVLDIEPWKVPVGFKWGLGAKQNRRFRERNANSRVQMHSHVVG